MKFGELMPRKGEQCAVIGQTGTGKSIWIEKMLRWFDSNGLDGYRYPSLLFDYKYDSTFSGLGNIVSKGKDIAASIRKYNITIYRPKGPEARDAEYQDEILEWCYQHEGMIVTVDESRKLTNNPLVIGQGLDDICTRGRSKDILRIFGMQRPTRVARITLSESNMFYVRRVVDKRDRQTIAGFSDESQIDKIYDKFGMRVTDINKNKTWYFPHTPR